MPARTMSGRRQKGQDFQKEEAGHICRKLRVSPSDLRSTPSGSDGPDLWLSEQARSIFPFAAEMKRVETFQVWETIRQAEENAAELGMDAIVIFRRNRSKTYCILDFDIFLNFLAAYNSLRTLYEGLRVAYNALKKEE